MKTFLLGNIWEVTCTPPQGVAHSQWPATWAGITAQPSAFKKGNFFNVSLNVSSPRAHVETRLLNPHVSLASSLPCLASPTPLLVSPENTPSINHLHNNPCLGASGAPKTSWPLVIPMNGWNSISCPIYSSTSATKRKKDGVKDNPGLLGLWRLPPSQGSLHLVKMDAMVKKSWPAGRF